MEAGHTEHSYTTFELEKIKTQIEKMSKTHHIEILNLLKRYPSVTLNENKSGVFVNLSFLPKEVIEDLVKYVSYVNDQENVISSVEIKKENLKDIFFL